MIQMQTLMPLCDSDLESGLSSDGSASFIVKGRRVAAQLTKSGITFTAAPSRWPSAHKSYLTAGVHSGADGADEAVVCAWQLTGQPAASQMLASLHQIFASSWQSLSGTVCPARWPLLQRQKLPARVPFLDILSAATSESRAVWRSCCHAWRGALQVLSATICDLHSKHVAPARCKVLPHALAPDASSSSILC